MNSPLMEAYKAIQTASNSDALLRQKLSNLPNGKQILTILDQCGGNYEQAAKMGMQTLGVNMDDLANLAKMIGL